MKYRIAETDNVTLDYNPQKDEYILSFFKDNHFQDEYFYKREMFKGQSTLYTGYCPLCDKDIYHLNEMVDNCPNCGHHISMREME